MREAERERESETNRRDFEISASRSKETVVTSETEKRYLPSRRKEERKGERTHVTRCARAF